MKCPKWDRVIKLLRKVDLGSPNQCWTWKGCKNGDGYGLYWDNSTGTMKTIHRFVVEWMLGRKLIKPEQALHTCDNRACCNPFHLYVGTQTENIRDMVTRGRVNDRRGEKNPCCRTTKETVLLIRKLYKTGTHTYKTLGKMFNVCSSQIGNIVNRDSWLHLEK